MLGGFSKSAVYFEGFQLIKRYGSDKLPLELQQKHAFLRPPSPTHTCHACMFILSHTHIHKEANSSPWHFINRLLTIPGGCHVWRQSASSGNEWTPTPSGRWAVGRNTPDQRAEVPEDLAGQVLWETRQMWTSACFLANIMSQYVFINWG